MRYIHNFYRVCIHHNGLLSSSQKIRIFVTILYQEAAPVESSVITKVTEGGLKINPIVHLFDCLIVCWSDCFSFVIVCPSSCLFVLKVCSSDCPFAIHLFALFVCLHFSRFPNIFQDLMQVKGTTTSVKDGSDGFEIKHIFDDKHGSENPQNECVTRLIWLWMGISVTKTKLNSTRFDRVWDEADYVVPPAENGAFFITTNVLVTPNQTQSRCPENQKVNVTPAQMYEHL